jgi:subtilisin family serine protease
MNGHCLPRRLLVTLRLGEMPAHVPSWQACAAYGVPHAEVVDGGALDRLLRHFGGAARAGRLHSARTPVHAMPDVAGARRYDDVEQLSGVARVLRIEVERGERLHDLMQALSQLPHVEAVRPERLVLSPLDATPPAAHAAVAPLVIDAQEAWRSRELIRLPQALAYEVGDETVLIGLADTGVAGMGRVSRLALRPGFDTVDLRGAHFEGMTLVDPKRDHDGDPTDEVGHGTGCAGILCGDVPELPPGAAGRCSLLPARVLGAAQRGQRRVGVGSVANIDAGMKRLIDLGAKVINMSFGTPESQLAPDEPRPHAEVVRYALSRGVILVAASGNSGQSERFYPAAHPGVIAVGAVDGEARPARFSTRGAHVALSAPGEGVWSFGLDGWQRANGTSFAAPFVSAACALMVARAGARAWPLEAAQARELLMQAARPFAQAGVDGLGRGVLDVHAALRALDDWIDSRDDDAADA